MLTPEKAAALASTNEPLVRLPKIGSVPKSLVDSDGIKTLRRLVDSICIIDKTACWDHFAMFDLRDLLCSASSAAPEWPKLTAPATVHGTTFGVGVSSRLVVECAQRHAVYASEEKARTPEQRQDDERNRRTLWDMLNGPPNTAPSTPTKAPNLLNADALCTAFCAKWSGAEKAEVGDVLDWIMQQPVYRAPRERPGLWGAFDKIQASKPPDPTAQAVNPTMTHDELVAAAESIGMRFPAVPAKPTQADQAQRDVPRLTDEQIEGMHDYMNRNPIPRHEMVQVFARAIEFKVRELCGVKP